MNCLEARRALLAEPRHRTSTVQAHLASCAACDTVAIGLAQLDDRIVEAASVPAPDALAHRVLLGHARRPTLLLHYAAAATLLVAVVFGWAAATGLIDTGATVDVVGPGHPGVEAITEVEQDIPHARVSDAEASRELEQVLGRLGLALKNDEVTAHYVGKCQVAGADCDHIVLTTQGEHVNVMLVPEYPLGERTLVSDGRMSALVSPVRDGGYIVVADTPKKARRMARLLVKAAS